MKSKPALLIIDMQKGSFSPETPRWDTEGVVSRINKLAAVCRKANWPVIFIQHDGTNENDFIPGSERWKILSSLNVRDTDRIISKTANNCFYQSELEAYLQEKEVVELMITGCATDFCVESTVQAALCLDYKVKVVEDGHTTGERPNLTARQVIDHHNWIWRNMIPTIGNIQVLKTEEILQTPKLLSG